MKRYECYYTNDLGYDYSAFVRDADEGQFVEYDDLQAWALKLKEVVEGMEHAMGCGFAWVEDLQPGCSITRQDERLCDCKRGEALRLLGEVFDPHA